MTAMGPTVFVQPREDSDEKTSDRIRTRRKFDDP